MLEEASVVKPYVSLLPLVNAYKADIGNPLLIKDWNDLLDDDSHITKIAEASYAEVYKVTTNAGNSILKVMTIKLPELPASLRSETSIDVNLLISEIRIMNALTEIPGFVTFKDAHLVNGVIPRCILEAYDDHVKKLERRGGKSEFPHPIGYDEETMFLVIELGDAGVVLDEYKLDTIHEFWDIFIGVTVALARAEVFRDFEVSRSSTRTRQRKFFVHF